MKKIIKIMFVFAICLLFIACNKKEETKTKEITKENTPIIETKTKEETKEATKIEPKTKEKTKELTVINYDAILDEAYKTFEFPETVKDNINLSNTISYEEYYITVTYDFNNEYITNTGVVTHPYENDEVVNGKVILTLLDNYKEYEIDFTISSMKTLCEAVSNSITLPNETNTDLELPTDFDLVTVEWNSSNSRVLNKNGILSYVSEDTDVTLTCTIYMEEGDETYFTDDLRFIVTAKRWDAERRIGLVENSVELPTETKFNLNLPTELDYDILCSWSSADTNVISNDGKITRGEIDNTVTLTLTLYCTDSSFTKDYEYTVTVLLKSGDEEESDHNIIDFATNFVSENMSNLILDGDIVKLTDGAVTGSYESKVFETLGFTDAVGSFSCTSSKNAKVECMFSVRVNGTWSKYFSYGNFGLGNNNGYSDTSDSIAKISTDEIIVLNSKKADAFKYKFTLTRDAVTTESPKMKLVCMALNIPGHTCTIDTSGLPNSWDWDVPKLYQHDVPSIGGSICSPTTTTMLLMWKGISFNYSGYSYPHQYIANMAKDYTHAIFGNWSYNMITAGALGASAYVARMYSWDEVRYQLVNVGPMGASIKGNFGTYTTNGHLIVVRGYRIENGKTTVICNDPNVRGTYYEVTLDIFMNAWRNVSYVLL